jgi:hypothetical protein
MLYRKDEVLSKSNIMITLSLERLEELRDITYQRTSDMRIRTLSEVVDFINVNGMVFAFRAKASELPCLWHAACGERSPEIPVHTHHDPNLGLVWKAKDILPMEKKIYYGKALRKTPTMISLKLFPYFYAVKGYPADPFKALPRESLSQTAVKIVKALENGPPMTTRELKIASGCSSSGRRYIFDKAMAELQELLLIVKIAEEYEPFTFIWGRLDRWLTSEVENSRKLNPDEARYTLLNKYFSRVIAARADHIIRLFGWTPAIVDRTLKSLQDREIISDRITIPGGGWFIHREHLRQQLLK